MDDAFTDDNVALGEAAQVNFKIAARTQHGLAKNSFFIIAMAQLDEIVDRLLEREESEKSQIVPSPPDPVPI
ncbi:hypothetical protein [uncultured Thalassospira sp.]|uniref:hypothetical protein n=1 Tax=uncultured Thalassospira sp. TaxID=404382 RepID=UPI0030DDCBDD|tara:strand:+ start:11162 stop:11377 length:216 start_codon:yes stop_codon:yes gene_type:complete